MVQEKSKVTIEKDDPEWKVAIEHRGEYWVWYGRTREAVIKKSFLWLASQQLNLEKSVEKALQALQRVKKTR